MIRKVITKYGDIVYFLTIKRVKNINIRIKKEGVFVSASNKVSLDDIDDFIIKKSDIIIKYLNKISLYYKEKEYVTGEKIYYLGKKLNLVVIENKKNYVRLDNNNFYIYVFDIDNIEKKKNMVDNWYKNEFEKIYLKIAYKIYKNFEEYEIDFPKFKIRKMKSTWGNCRPYLKVVTLNYNLIKYPIICLEYVLAHEFCHLIYQNHSDKFYKLLTKIMPDWKERREILNSQK